MRHSAIPSSEPVFRYLERLYARHGLDAAELDDRDVAELGVLVVELGAAQEAWRNSVLASAAPPCGERFELVAGGVVTCILPRGHATLTGERSAHADRVFDPKRDALR